MPAKNTVKDYRADSYYHIYNRGVEKRVIFTSEKDYQVFLSYLKIYLSPRDKDSLRLNLQEASNWSEKEKIINKINLNNFSKEIDLLSYCLMPNHFHLLIKQKPTYAIKSFMQSLISKYSIYFNKQHDRVGSLFQGIYKAVRVKSESQLIYLSKYIHLNPKEKSLTYKYSSLPNYLGKINQTWVKPGEIKSYFSKEKPNSSYLSFINEKDNNIYLNSKYMLD